MMCISLKIIIIECEDKDNQIMYAIKLAQRSSVEDRVLAFQLAIPVYLWSPKHCQVNFLSIEPKVIPEFHLPCGFKPKKDEIIKYWNLKIK